MKSVDRRLPNTFIFGNVGLLIYEDMAEKGENIVVIYQTSKDSF